MNSGEASRDMSVVLKPIPFEAGQDWLVVALNTLLAQDVDALMHRNTPNQNAELLLLTASYMYTCSSAETVCLQHSTTTIKLPIAAFVTSKFTEHLTYE